MKVWMYGYFLFNKVAYFYLFHTIPFTWRTEVFKTTYSIKNIIIDFFCARMYDFTVSKALIASRILPEGNFSSLRSLTLVVKDLLAFCFQNI
jgi:hypothetical protein